MAPSPKARGEPVLAFRKNSPDSVITEVWFGSRHLGDISAATYDRHARKAGGGGYSVELTLNGLRLRTSDMLLRDLKERIKAFVARAAVDTRNSPIHHAATPANLQAARDFALEQWRARAAERAASEANTAAAPDNLSSACKFCSLFAHRIFGGELRGNWHHQWVELPTGQRIDLTEGSLELAQMQSRHRAGGPDPYAHDPAFFGNPEHLDSLRSCAPRVRQWTEEFLRQHPLPMSTPTQEPERPRRQP